MTFACTTPKANYEIWRGLYASANLCFKNKYRLVRERKNKKKIIKYSKQNKDMSSLIVALCWPKSKAILRSFFCVACAVQYCGGIFTTESAAVLNSRTNVCYVTIYNAEITWFPHLSVVSGESGFVHFPLTSSRISWPNPKECLSPYVLEKQSCRLCVRCSTLLLC
jgi:hypothetical protein